MFSHVVIDNPFPDTWDCRCFEMHRYKLISTVHHIINHQFNLVELINDGKDTMLKFKV